MNSCIWHTIEGALVSTQRFAVTDADSEFLYTPPRTSVGGRGQGVLDQLWEFGKASVINRSGGTSTAFGIGTHIDPAFWRAGQWTHATTTYTDDTADAQDADTTDFAMETTTADDGHLIGCVFPFTVIGYDVGQASAGAGAAPVRVVEYSRLGGTWASLTNGYVNPVTGAHWPTGERAVVLFSPPPGDWVPMAAAHGTNVPQGYYGLRVRATTPPSGAGVAVAIASRIVLGSMFTRGALTNGAQYDFIEAGFPLRARGAHVAMCVSRDTDTTAVANTAGSTATIVARNIG